MAKGRPDYFSGVDIAYQALSQVIVRPKYGGARRVVSVVTVTASELNELLSVDGKGMIYGGFLRIDYSSSQKASNVLLSIDSADAVTGILENLDKFGINDARGHPVFIQKFDDSNFLYCVGFSYGLTFETDFKVSYIESHGTTPLVSCVIVYALI